MKDALLRSGVAVKAGMDVGILVGGTTVGGADVGGAVVSEKHANFIVNPRGAGSAADIEALIEHVRATVQAQTGVELEAEVRIVGETRKARAGKDDA